MDGFVPPAPPVVDDRDQFRCVTEAQLQTNPTLKSQASKVLAALKASQAKRRKAQEQGFGLAWTYAPDYASMQSVKRAGCYETDGHLIPGVGARECGSAFAGERWLPEERKLMYSDGPPELVRRMTDSRLSVPEDLHCLVKDVSAKGEVHCESGGELQYVVWIDRSKATTINRGDLVATKSIQVRKAGPTSPWVLGREEPASARVVEASTCCSQQP